MPGTPSTESTEEVRRSPLEPVAKKTKAVRGPSGTSSTDLSTDEASLSCLKPPVKKPKSVRRPRLPVMPTLRSSRGRDLKLTVRFKNEGLKDDDTNWTPTERKQLLDALKQHGSSDVEKLAQAVPTRSATAVNHFLMERRRKKDRIVLEGATGRRTAQALRVLRRALDAKRRRFDRSQVLTQVMVSCQQQPFSEPLDDDDWALPQLGDVYQMLQELMENKVPAVLGSCEQYVVRRLLGTLALIVDSSRDTLGEEHQVLSRQLAWAASQPVLGSSKGVAAKPKIEAGEKLSLNFPTMDVRKQHLKSSWNPLLLPTEVIQRQWLSINNLLTVNVFRSWDAGRKEESAPPVTVRGACRREPQPLEVFCPWKR